MSEAAVPFSETKAPEAPDRLNRGALRLVDISASTMANIGPAYSFYFGAGFLFLTAGIAAPLTIIVAGIAIALLGNTLSEFSRAHPSTGGFISYVGKTFGGTSAVTTALLCGAGYIVAISSVLAICGGYISMVLQYYFNVDIPWVLFLGGLHRGRDVHDVPRRGRVHQAGRAVLRLRDAGAYRGVGGRDHQERRAPVRGAVRAQPHHQRLQRPRGRIPARHLPLHRLRRIPPRSPRKRATPGVNVPRAVFLSIALMVTGYVLYAYATATDFNYNVTALSGAAIPFINVSHNIAAWLSMFAWIAGITSTLGVLISAVNSQARLIFNAGREGLLPRWLGRVHPVRRTPVNAMFAFVAIAALIIAAWALLHLIGGDGGSMSALNFFVESSTMGTILVLVVYFLSNLALPFYYRKYRPQEFNVVKHAVLPVLGMIAIGVPVYYLVKPGQPSPYDWFPYAALGVVIVSVAYAYFLSRRDPGLGERVGSIVADE